MSFLSEEDYIKKVDGLAWYLIRTMPRMEQRAEMFFKSNGIPCYLPKYNKTYINSFTGKNGKKYLYKRPPVLVPMFPGYIFSALDLSTIGRSRRERSIAQVCLHINYSEEELITDLNKVKDFEFMAKNNAVEIKQEINVGTNVTIIRGPFKGWCGIVERREDNNFIWVRISSIGYSLGMEIPIVDCEELK